MGTPLNKNKWKSIYLSLEHPDYNKIKNLSIKYNKGVTYIIRTIIKKYLKEREEKEKSINNKSNE